MQVLIFPEGTNLTAETLAKSKAFSEREKLPAAGWDQVMAPRSTGFFALFQALALPAAQRAAEAPFPQVAARADAEKARAELQEEGPFRRACVRAPACLACLSVCPTVCMHACVRLFPHAFCYSAHLPRDVFFASLCARCLAMLVCSLARRRACACLRAAAVCLAWPGVMRGVAWRGAAVDAVYDLTVAYHPVVFETEKDVAAGRFPQEVHVLCERYGACRAHRLRCAGLCCAGPAKQSKARVCARVPARVC